MPAYSMTGFGQAEAVTPIGSIRVEMRSVNNRYLEINSYLPRSINAIDGQLKKVITTALSRGTVNVSVTFDRGEQSDLKLKLNKTLAAEYVGIARDLKKSFKLDGEVTVSDILRYNDIILSESAGLSTEAVWKQLKPILEKSIENFKATRLKEGTFILNDMKKVLKNIEKTLAAIEKRAPARLKVQSATLKERIEKLAPKLLEPARLALEVALIADKLDIAEEATRLHAHIKKMQDDMLDDSEPIGKKLGFLLQEMNREANTIGSKANDADISHLSVSLKEDIEKIREQSLNLE